MKISVLIPAFDEARSIESTIARVATVLGASGIDYETIVIDDGSTDETAALAEATGARVLRHPANAGYGRALKTGLRAASGEWVAIVDADGTYPVEDLPRLLEGTPRFDMVVGARRGAHYRGSLLKWLGRQVLERMVHFVAGVRVPDVNSGMRVFRKTIALANIARIGNGFSFTTTLTLAMLLEGHFVQYVPIDYAPRIGTSKVRMSRDTLRMLQILVMAINWYNPLKLFLLLAYLLVLVVIPCVILDFVLAGGSHIGLIGVVGGASVLLLFGMGLVTDVLRRLPNA
jgi:glycosyltransferase involved in cell wall biosynthesis